MNGKIHQDKVVQKTAQSNPPEYYTVGFNNFLNQIL